MSAYEDWENEGLDPDGPSPEDLERFGSELRTCPECGSDVYDQAEMCPVCGRALSQPSSGPGALTIAIALVLVAMLAGVVVWLF